MSPWNIVCANFPNCNHPVSEQGKVCDDCKAREKQHEANRWQWAGFGKWVDNSHKHTTPKKAKHK